MQYAGCFLEGFELSLENYIGNVSFVHCTFQKCHSPSLNHKLSLILHVKSLIFEFITF